MRTRVLPLLFVAACGPTAVNSGDDTSGDDAIDEPDARPWVEGPDAQPSERCNKIDLLFVIDNSGSMGEEQTNLATNFPAFIQVIEESGLDYRVAVTTTAVDYTYYQQLPIGGTVPTTLEGESGAMLQPSGCNMTSRWIDSTTADPAAAFSCAAAVGVDGSSDEMPLAAMRAAFDDRMTDGTNTGFRRPDALLGVVLLTDENDCSYEQSVTLSFSQFLCESQMEPVSNYVGFLDTYTGDRGRWATAVIAGPGPDACTSDFGNADYAQRLDEFVTMTGTNAVFSSICDGDLTTGLSAALELFNDACDAFPPIE